MIQVKNSDLSKPNGFSIALKILFKISEKLTGFLISSSWLLPVTFCKKSQNAYKHGPNYLDTAGVRMLKANLENHYFSENKDAFLNTSEKSKYI